MNVCIAILRLKIEKKVTFLAYYALLFQERKKFIYNAKKKVLCRVYREGAMTDQMCQKWFAKFCAGDFSPDNSPQLGRPVEADSNQIKT